MRAGRGAGARTSGEAWPASPSDPGSFCPRAAGTQPPPALGGCRRRVSGQAAGCGEGGSSRWVSFGAGSAVGAPLVCSSQPACLAEGPVGSAVGGSGPGLCVSLTRLLGARGPSLRWRGAGGFFLAGLLGHWEEEGAHSSGRGGGGGGTRGRGLPLGLLACAGAPGQAPL